jgi:flagellar biosynthetic protein FliQ
MTDAATMGVLLRTLQVTVEVAAPLLGLILAVGLAGSVVQSAMQLQDPTLTYVPRLLAAALGLVVFGRWMLLTLLHFSTAVLGGLGGVVR